MRLGDALAPAGLAVAVEADEQERAVVRSAEAGLEEVGERKSEQSDFQAVDVHGRPVSGSAITIPCTARRAGLARTACYTRGAWPSATSRSTGRSGRARPRWPSGSPPGSKARRCSRTAENPFLADFYAERPGAALQAQLFFLLNRHRQLSALRQADLFSQTTVCDYVFDKDKIFAFLNLDDNELFIYQRLYELLARDVPPPDLVVYLQTPTDVLLRRAAARDPARGRDAAARRRLPARAERGLPALLLPLHFDAAARGRDLAVRSRARRRGARRPHASRSQAMRHGTRYYVPRTRR